MHHARSALSPRILIAIIICAGAVCVVQAQEPQDTSAASGVQILKLRWSKQVRLPNNYDPAIIPTSGAFPDPASKQVAPRPSSGADPKLPNTSTNSNATFDSDGFFPATPRRLPVYYLYSLKIKNRANKRIEAVAWTYTFLDPKTKAELGKHEFLSYRKIAAGGEGVFTNALRAPPTRVVQSSQEGKAVPQLTEQATIECVLFGDETTWRNPRASADVCKALVDGHTSKRKQQQPR